MVEPPWAAQYSTLRLARLAADMSNAIIQQAPRHAPVVVQVLIYTALALVPTKMPFPEILPEPPHAIVADGNDPNLDELVAVLLVSAL